MKHFTLIDLNLKLGMCAIKISFSLLLILLGCDDDEKLNNNAFFTEPKADAQVCAEGHGGSLYRGDEHCCEHLEEQS